MAPTVETGAVNERPEDLRQDSVCSECGAVESEEDEHECED